MKIKSRSLSNSEDKTQTDLQLQQSEAKIQHFLERKFRASRSFATKKSYKFPPHEQVDRAGLVLWIKLKSSWFSPKNPQVKNVLLATQGNIKYNHKYNRVSVSDLKSINYLIQGREKVFSVKEVKRVVDRIYKNIVTK